MAVKFIADIGSNHNKDWERTVRLIAAAKSAGCDAVKFQYYKADRLYAKGFDVHREAARVGELPDRFIPMIAAECRELGLEFHCTPFHLDDVLPLLPYVDSLKIASYSMLDHPLILKCASTGKPLAVSTGGATADEIETVRSIALHRLPADKFTMFHCIPLYPAPIKAGMMKVGYETGYSDHTVKMAAVLAAIAADMRTIEFHLDLDDCLGNEYRHGHCWTVGAASCMIETAKMFDRVIGEPVDPIDYTEMRKWRADSLDGARPLFKYRKELSER